MACLSRWQYFPRGHPAGGNLDVSVVFYNLPAPVTRSFQSPVPTHRHSWLREFNIQFLPLGSWFDFLMTAAPLTPAKDASADPSCNGPFKSS